MVVRLPIHSAIAICTIAVAGLLPVATPVTASGPIDHGSCPPTPKSVAVKLVIAPRSIVAGEPLHFRVDNTSGPTITYGADYNVQECVDGVWILAPFSPTVATRQRIRQRPGRGRWWDVATPSIAEAGRYRIKKLVEIGRNGRWLYEKFNIVVQSSPRQSRVLQLGFQR